MAAGRDGYAEQGRPHITRATKVVLVASVAWCMLVPDVSPFGLRPSEAMQQATSSPFALTPKRCSEAMIAPTSSPRR